jgi:hypothetical protein
VHGNVRGLSWATHMGVGVTSAAELTDIVTARESCTLSLADATLESTALELIDPRHWRFLGRAERVVHHGLSVLDHDVVGHGVFQQ